MQEGILFTKIFNWQILTWPRFSFDSKIYPLRLLVEIFIGVDIRAIDLVVTGIFSRLRSKDKTTIVPLILAEMYKGLSDSARGITNNCPYMTWWHN
jgi:hypothetical protein